MKIVEIKGKENIQQWLDVNKWGFDKCKSVITKEDLKSCDPETLFYFERDESMIASEYIPEIVLNKIKSCSLKHRYLAIVIPLVLYWKIEDLINIIPDYVFDDTVQIKANDDLYKILREGFPKRIFNGTLDSTFLEMVFLSTLDDEEEFQFAAKHRYTDSFLRAAIRTCEDSKDIPMFLQIYSIWKQFIINKGS